jgi:hypothetical protein
LLCKGNKNLKNNLFYFDIRKLINEGSSQDNLQTHAMITSNVKRKTTLSSEKQIFIHRLHQKLNHRNFASIASMIRNGVLLNVPVSAAEVEALAIYNNCLSCALAKWKKQDHKIGSGIRPSRPGQSWSFDYQGPYSPPTPDGCTGKITFICLYTLYAVMFTVRSKTETFECLLKCKQHGHSMETARCDSGSVEMSREFQEKCQDIGVTVSEAAIENMQQNPFERYAQTSDNGTAAMFNSQCLLGAKWWGYLNFAYWQGHNAMSNHLHPLSTPNMEFEGKSTNLNTMFKFACGDPVIVKKTGQQKKLPINSRNEFGVVLVPGTSMNGATLCWLPERKNNYVALRLDVRLINLGMSTQITVEEGISLLP